MKFIDLHDFKTFNKRLSKGFMWMFLLLIVSIILTQLFFKLNPQYIAKYLKGIAPQFDKISNIPSKTFIEIFLNNLKISVCMVIAGLIPYIFLPAFMVIRNGFYTSVVIAALAYKLKKYNVLLIILLGVAPHGIFEFPAIVYAASIGVYVAKYVYILRTDKSERIVSENQGQYMYLDDIIPKIIKSFVFIIIPLLAIAALIETYITPALLNSLIK